MNFISAMSSSFNKKNDEEKETGHIYDNTNDHDSTSSIIVNSYETMDEFLTLMEESQKEFLKLTQDQVDKIYEACALEACKNRIVLASEAVEEAGMGVLEDKTIKNHFAAEMTYHAYAKMKTCGVVREDKYHGYLLHADPIGILAAIVPCTNPTSTTIFKALIALKTRNCIMFSPHPRTVQCTIRTAEIIRDAAIKAGAPKHCIGWISPMMKPDQHSEKKLPPSDVAAADNHPFPSAIELCNALMRHRKVAMIVATGAGGLIKSAYSCGKPCMGGGAGNTPVIIDEIANIPMAVNSTLLSKTFDHGMICASEQGIVVVKSVAEKVKQEFVRRGGYFLANEEEKRKLAEFIFKDERGTLNPAAVGKSPTTLLLEAGIIKHDDLLPLRPSSPSQQQEEKKKKIENVCEELKNAVPSKSTAIGCRVILAELQHVGPQEPLSREKLCPCLGFYVEDDFNAALKRALQLVQFGGLGHTAVLYTDPNVLFFNRGRDNWDKGKTNNNNNSIMIATEHVQEFQNTIPAGRVLICMPASQGAIGGMFNPVQNPSMSLGCGSWGGNSSSEGLQPKHLLNYKQVVKRFIEMPQNYLPPDFMLKNDDDNMCMKNDVVEALIEKAKKKHKMLQSYQYSTKYSSAIVCDKKGTTAGAVFLIDDTILNVIPSVFNNILNEFRQLEFNCSVINVSNIWDCCESSNEQHHKSPQKASNNHQPNTKEKKQIIKNESLKSTLFIDTVHAITDTRAQEIYSVVSSRLDSKPCFIVAFGHSFVLDVAKLICLMIATTPATISKHEFHWDSLGTRFLNPETRIIKFPTNEDMPELICVPTFTGWGSESTPFATIVVNNSQQQQKQKQEQKNNKEIEKGICEHSITTDESCGSQKVLTIVIDNQCLTPVPITDWNLCCLIPPNNNCIIESGFNALSNLIESYVSIYSYKLVDTVAHNALSLLLNNFDSAITNEEARQACYKAGYLSGICSGRSFLGIAAALAHQLSLYFSIPIGIAKVMVLCQVIRYNAEEAPSKLATHPQYEKPSAKSRYAELYLEACSVEDDDYRRNNSITTGKKHHHHSPSSSTTQEEEKKEKAVTALVSKIEQLKSHFNIAGSIQSYGIEKKPYETKINCMALGAFDSQFISTNPRYPLITELVQILKDCYYGTTTRTLRFNEAYILAALE